MGLKIASFENINNQGDVALNHLEYNEIGQLTKKNLHNDTQATTFAYNERGWMKNSISDQFSMKLDYEDGAAQGYNGNITKQYWAWSNTANPTANIFNYGYDKLNRLGSAATTAGVSMSEALTYDVMGNIASLNRDGAGAKVYNYYNSGSSNRLQSVSGLTTQNYEYDANGNATKDGLNGISLTYNYLNLPATAVRTTGTAVTLSYTYDATGKKLAKNSSGTVRGYVDGIEYKQDGTIDIIHTEEGVAQNNGSGTYTYHYNLSDHLGNVRYTFDVLNGIISPLQKDDYYAFGKRKTSMLGSVDNKYLYNGKELQEELGQYDYGARFYDPVIGRWNVVDPMAEFDRKTSPYTYAFNDPIRHTDPDGMFGEDMSEDFDGGEDPKPKQTASTGVLTVGGAILRGLATIAEGVEVVGVGASSAIAGVVVGVFLPQDMGTNGWRPSPKPDPLIIPAGVVTFKQVLEYNNKLKDDAKADAKPGSRAGQPFTPKEKQKVVKANQEKNGGKVVCEGCGVETTKPEKSKRGVTPPKTDRQVDHKKAKSKGGSGTAENGQVLCRDCNIKKSNN